LGNAEIQEVRHSSSSSTSPTHLNSLLTTLAESVTNLEPRITRVTPESRWREKGDDNVRARIEELIGEWSSLADQHAMLKEEMKEDGWLIRFRSWAIFTFSDATFKFSGTDGWIWV